MVTLPALAPAAALRIRRVAVTAAVAVATLVALPGTARADIVEQPADGFTLACRGLQLQAVGGADGGRFVFATTVSDAAESADGTTSYRETVTTALVRLVDPASGAAYTIGGVDGQQGSTLDTLITGERISGTYHARWTVRAADGSILGDSDTFVDYASGAVTVTGSCVG